jgi:proline iminopeptidase
VAQFQPIEPYENGLLDVGDGHQIYWECCGNPAGKPALFLHGGPGTGCSIGQRSFFDPNIYKVCCSISVALAVAFHSRVN